MDYRTRCGVGDLDRRRSMVGAGTGAEAGRGGSGNRTEAGDKKEYSAQSKGDSISFHIRPRGNETSGGLWSGRSLLQIRAVVKNSSGRIRRLCCIPHVDSGQIKAMYYRYNRSRFWLLVVTNVTVIGY